MRLFLKRHPQITLRTPEFVTNASSKVSKSDIESWFRKIREFLAAHGWLDVLDDPERVYNGDETSFYLNPKTKSVFALRGSRNVYDIEKSSSKTNITTMFSFSAAGKVVPPTIIYPYKTIPKGVADSVPSKWGIAKSDSGWMTSDVFRDYIRNVFHPFIESNNIPKPVLYIIDGHSSHINLNTSEMCRELGIILIALYPNVTRIMQPADVSAFKPLKNGWPKAVARFRSKNPMATVTTTNFATVLQDCLRNSLTVQTIKNGFKASGLFPWDSSAIDFSKCLGKDTQEGDALELDEVEPLEESFQEELENARNALQECAKTIGSERIQQFKSEFVCLQNNEEGVLFKIFTILEKRCPDIVNAVQGNDDNDDTFCDIDFGEPIVATEDTCVQMQIVEAEIEKDGQLPSTSSDPSSPHQVSADSASSDPPPSDLALENFLNTPPTPTRTNKREYKSKRYHVLTSDEFIEEFRQKEEDKRRLEQEKENRKIARMERKRESDLKKQKQEETKRMRQSLKEDNSKKRDQRPKKNKQNVQQKKKDNNDEQRD